MEIWVEFDSSTKKFRTMPDPAIVSKGTPVNWRFRTDNTEGPARIRWSVYFHNGSPFGTYTIDIPTFSGRITGQHIALTATMFADDPGDYKYGVKAENASTGALLGEDDPKLEVTSG
jgi:hypothetical protein